MNDSVPNELVNSISTGSPLPVPERPEPGPTRVVDKIDFQPFQSLANRWRAESVRYKQICDSMQRGTPFWKSCWQRYVDYDRRASELEILIRVEQFHQVAR